MSAAHRRPSPSGMPPHRHSRSLLSCPRASYEYVQFIPPTVIHILLCTPIIPPATRLCVTRRTKPASSPLPRAPWFSCRRLLLPTELTRRSLKVWGRA